MDLVHQPSSSDPDGGGTGSSSRLSIPTSDGTAFIDLDDILFLKADGSYTLVRCGNGLKYIVSLHLHVMEMRLPSSMFYRCHHAYVVNLSKVTKLVHNGGHHVVLSTGDTVMASRRKWAGLVAAMEHV
jgi:two-component system LytT family response regulator